MDEEGNFLELTAHDALNHLRGKFAAIEGHYQSQVAEGVWLGFCMAYRAQSEQDGVYFHRIMENCENFLGRMPDTQRLPYAIMLYVLKAKDRCDRQKASKYARAIDLLLYENASVEEARERLHDEGVIKLAHLAAALIPNRPRTPSSAMPADRQDDPTITGPLGEDDPDEIFLGSGDQLQTDRSEPDSPTDGGLDRPRPGAEPGDRLEPQSSPSDHQFLMNLVCAQEVVARLLASPLGRLTIAYRLEDTDSAGFTLYVTEAQEVSQEAEPGHLPVPSQATGLRPDA